MTIVRCLFLHWESRCIQILSETIVLLEWVHNDWHILRWCNSLKMANCCAQYSFEEGYIRLYAQRGRDWTFTCNNVQRDHWNLCRECGKLLLCGSAQHIIWMIPPTKCQVCRSFRQQKCHSNTSQTPLQGDTTTIGNHGCSLPLCFQWTNSGHLKGKLGVKTEQENSLNLPRSTLNIGNSSMCRFFLLSCCLYLSSYHRFLNSVTFWI